MRLLNKPKSPPEFETMIKTRCALEIFSITFSILLTLCISSHAFGQSTAFNYQGKLTDGGNPANGNYDLQFALFDGLSGGTQIGSTLTRSDTAVSGGVFTVQLDYGVNAFPGANRFLEIGVRLAGVGSFTTLAPRQQISSTPYAIRTLSATTADGLSSACVSCVQDSQINSIAGTKITGQIPTASVPAGSANYIQNSNTQQSGNFNIAGNGTAGTLNVNGPLSVNGVTAPAVAPAGQGRLFFDSGTNKLRVSENGGAFINLVGANGVSGSGTTNTIPLWSAGTTLDNSVITQSGSNVGIGTTSPASKLHVNGEFTLDAAGPTLHTGTAAAEQNRYLHLINSPSFRSASGLKAGGILVGDSYDFANPGKNDLIVKGNVGVGTPNPQLTLHVVGTGIRFETGTKVMDISTGTLNDVVARNNSLVLSSQGPSGNNHVILNPFTLTGTPPFRNGNVGIGTFAPETKLHVENPGGAEITLRSPNEKAILALDSTLAGQRRVWTLESGLFGTPGLFGIYDRTVGRAALTIDTNGRAFVDGNVGQTESKFGLPKAMLEVNRSNGAVIRCYNAVSNLNSGTCGINVSPSLGVFFYIKFPFRVTDRFFSLTTQHETDAAAQLGMRGFDSNDISGQTAIVYYYSGIASAQSFFLIVY